VWLSIIVAFLCRNDSQLRHVERRDDPAYFNSPNIPPERNELCPDAAWPIPLSNSLPYRQPESIASISSPSSGSQYSSEGSPSSSPVPSLTDSIAGKSDSDTDSELWKIESHLQIGYDSLSDVPSYPAPNMNDRSLNKLVTSSVTYGCLLAPDPYTHFHPPQSANRMPSVQPAQCPINGQSVTSTISDVSVQSAPSMLSTICFQPAQPVRDVRDAQLAVSVPQIQRVPPAISEPPGCRNLPLAPSANTQAVIIQRNILPFQHIQPHPPNIQQGPVIPETVAVSARERIAAQVDKTMKDRVVVTLAEWHDDQLSRGDQHGDT